MGRVDCIGRYRWDSCTSQLSTAHHTTSHHSTEHYCDICSTHSMHTYYMPCVCAHKHTQHIHRHTHNTHVYVCSHAHTQIHTHTTHTHTHTPHTQTHTHNTHVYVHMHTHRHSTHMLLSPCRGVWCAIDWKTSRRPRPKLRDMYDGPLQVCAYMGAINQDQRYPVKVSGYTTHMHTGCLMCHLVHACCTYVYTVH